VNFATIIKNSSSTITDNIFIDSTRPNSSCTSPTVNGLSYYDAQFLTVNNISAKVNIISLKKGTRKINNETIAKFQHLLENERWEPVFKIRIQITSFVYILNIFEVSFPIQNKSVGRIKNNWIMKGKKYLAIMKESV
jgi:hypothetical protein